MTIVQELKEQITQWRHQQDLYEEMIEEAYKRIDELEEV